MRRPTSSRVHAKATLTRPVRVPYMGGTSYTLPAGTLLHVITNGPVDSKVSEVPPGDRIAQDILTVPTSALTPLTETPPLATDH